MTTLQDAQQFMGLTAVDIDDGTFEADVMEETLVRSSRPISPTKEPSRARICEDCGG